MGTTSAAVGAGLPNGGFTLLGTARSGRRNGVRIVASMCPEHGKVRTGDTRAATTGSGCPLFADAIINCIAKACDPTVQELFSVAARIWTDGAAERSVFDWDRLPAESAERLMAVRAAQFALCGSPMVRLDDPSV